MARGWSEDGPRMARGWSENGPRMVRGWLEDGARMDTTSLYFLSYNATPCYYTLLSTIPLHYTTILYHYTPDLLPYFLFKERFYINSYHYEKSVILWDFGIYSLLLFSTTTILNHYTIQLYSTTILQIYYLTFSSKRDFLLIMRNRLYYEISVQ